jgi:hypothetical protein
LVSEVVVGPDIAIDASGPLSSCPICAHPLAESLHREGDVWCCDTGHMFPSLGALLAAMTRAMCGTPSQRRPDAPGFAPHLRPVASEGINLPRRLATDCELLSA